MITEELDKTEKSVNSELLISQSLRLGVILSAVTIFIGFIMYIVTGKSGYPDSTFPTLPADIIKGIILLKPYAVISTGLLLLVLTPVFRVVISIITFIKEKDYLYAVITLIVLIILITSFLLGKAE